MKHGRMQTGLLIWSGLSTVWMLVSGSRAAEQEAGPTNEFFAFDNGVGMGKWTPDKQAQVLKELGYDGIGLHYFDDLTERIRVFTRSGLKVYNVYIGVDVDQDTSCPPKLKQAIMQLKGTRTDVWLYVRGKRKEGTARAVKLIREIADLANESGIRVALYPHYGFFLATAQDALRLVKAVDRKNVGLTFNLCHELRAGNARRFDDLIKEIAPFMFYASINGADHQGGWDKLIRPLDEGEYDLAGLLLKLKNAGYAGPIGLQCYAVKGDQYENLKRSMAAWRSF